MILGLLVVVALLVVLGGLATTLARRRSAGGPPGAPPSGSSVRRFFQYLLLLGLLMGAASGVTGLLGRALDDVLPSGGDTLIRDDTTLALQLTLTLIALPLWLLLAWWTRERLRQDPAERSSVGWSAYLLIVGLVSLVTAMGGWQGTLTGLLGVQTYGDLDGQEIALALVWTSVWLTHRLVALRQAGGPSLAVRPLDLLGSLIGLVTGAVGLIQLTAASGRALLGPVGSMVTPPLDDLLRAGVISLVGGVVWVVHWAARAVRGPRDPAWLMIVLLVGVGGGLVTAVVGASLLLYDVLVWLVGDPVAGSATVHFDPAPAQLGLVVVGLTVWWYHQDLLGEGSETRTEVRRVYEYLLSGIGLIAGAAGLTMVIVTVVEAATGRSDLLVGGSAVNALIAALVLLAVGLPVWWRHWAQAQRARAQDPGAELGSPSRRTYLLLLFGVATVASVVATLVLVFLVLEDALAGTLGPESLRRTRFALGVLATTSVLAAYHWSVFRQDRAEAPEPEAAAARPARRAHILLVGAADPAIADTIAQHTGASTQVVERTDTDTPAWDAEVLLSALAADGVRDQDVVVLSEAEGIRVIPVRR